MCEYSDNVFDLNGIMEYYKNELHSTIQFFIFSFKSYVCHQCIGSIHAVEYSFNWDDSLLHCYWTWKRKQERDCDSHFYCCAYNIPKKRCYCIQPVNMFSVHRCFAFFRAITTFFFRLFHFFFFFRIEYFQGLFHGENINYIAIQLRKKSTINRWRLQWMAKKKANRAWIRSNKLHVIVSSEMRQNFNISHYYVSHARFNNRN